MAGSRSPHQFGSLFALRRDVRIRLFCCLYSQLKFLWRSSKRETCRRVYRVIKRCLLCCAAHQEIVARFIEENLELLLSVAMGHWFESMSPTRNSDSKDLTESQKLFQKSQRFYDKVREARYQLLQGLRLGYDRSISAMGGASLDLAGDNGLKFRHLQFSVCLRE